MVETTGRGSEVLSLDVAYGQRETDRQLRLGGRSVAQQQRLQGRVALITGGGRGIGQAIALAYAAEGTKLALADRTEVQKLFKGKNAAVRSAEPHQDKHAPRLNARAKDRIHLA